MDLALVHAWQHSHIVCGHDWSTSNNGQRPKGPHNTSPLGHARQQHPSIQGAKLINIQQGPTWKVRIIHFSWSIRDNHLCLFEGHDWSIYNKDQSEKGPHTTQRSNVERVTRFSSWCCLLNGAARTCHASYRKVRSKKRFIVVYSDTCNMLSLQTSGWLLKMHM